MVNLTICDASGRQRLAIGIRNLTLAAAFNGPQERSLTDRLWQQAVNRNGIWHVHHHYEPRGFERICRYDP
jgi:hypothetical protein